jgi:hypothetical protein
VLVPLALTTADGAVHLVGPALRDLPVESLTCEACGTETVTRDLPPVGIDVAAVLDELATGATRTHPGTAPVCVCGARALTLSAVLTLVVHTAGATMVGEVSSGPVCEGTLSCAGCSRSWAAADHGHPPQVQAAIATFNAALSSGEISWSD